MRRKSASQKASDMEEAVNLLKSKRGLDREKGILALKSLFPFTADPHPSTLPALLNALTPLINSETWEHRHGGLTAIKGLIVPTGPEERVSLSDLSLLSSLLISSSHRLLTDTEVRVRIAAGDAVALICFVIHRVHGKYIFTEVLEEKLIDNIEDHMFIDRDPTADESEEGKKLKKKLLDGLEANEERQADGGRGGEADSALSRIKKKESTRDSYISSVSSIYHDTAGWKTLETTIKCIQKVYDFTSDTYRPVVGDTMMELVLNCCVHINRYTREAAFFVLASLCKCLDLKYDDGEEAMLADQIVSRLTIGLVDDWSDVCYAASTATRAFMTNLYNSPSGVTNGAHHGYEYKKQLLPRMCFNRYHFAEGVKRYSLETWLLILKETGREVVAEYIESICHFYISRLRSDNNEMRGSACLCINELLTKISPSVTAPYASSMFSEVAVALDDNSWSVRNYACVTVGSFVDAFFENTIVGKVHPLLDVLFECLGDETWTVRESSAVSIGKIYGASGKDPAVVNSISHKMKLGLAAVKDQPDDRARYGGVDLMTAKMMRDNDAALHSKGTSLTGCCAVAVESERQRHGFFGPFNLVELARRSDGTGGGTMEDFVSLGSVAGDHLLGALDDVHSGLNGNTKENDSQERDHISCGGGDHHDHHHHHTNNDAPFHSQERDHISFGGGDHHDHHHHHTNEYQRNHLWEITDGCVYLLREVVCVAHTKFTDKETVGKLVDILGCKQFINHHKLMETVWKVLPVYAEQVGKKTFKASMEPFLDGLIYSLESSDMKGFGYGRGEAELAGVDASAIAAKECALALSTFLGPNIFKGRVESYNMAYWDIIEKRIPQFRFRVNVNLKC